MQLASMMLSRGSKGPAEQKGAPTPQSKPPGASPRSGAGAGGTPARASPRGASAAGGGATSQSPRRAPLVLLTPKPLSAYGRAVNNFVDLNLGMSQSSSADKIEDMTAELSAELEESVKAAAEQGCTESQLADMLTQQLHKTVATAANTARDDLAETVEAAQDQLVKGQTSLANLKRWKDGVINNVLATQQDIGGYFASLRQLLDERESQMIKEAALRGEALEKQLRLVSKHVAEIQAASDSAVAASEGEDLSLLHQKPLIDKVFEQAMDIEWPTQPATGTDMHFIGGIDIHEHINAVGSVEGGMNADPMEGASPEVREIIGLCDHMFTQADTDGDGCINDAELKKLVFKMYTDRGSYPSDLTQRVRTETNHYMMIFDKDANDEIDKMEFQRMMCSHPWKDLLPAHLQGSIPALKKYFGI